MFIVRGANSLLQWVYDLSWSDFGGLCFDIWGLYYNQKLGSHSGHYMHSHHLVDFEMTRGGLNIYVAMLFKRNLYGPTLPVQKSSFYMFICYKDALNPYLIHYGRKKFQNIIQDPWQYSTQHSRIFPTFSLNGRISGNVLWNIVDPTEHCYGSE